MTVQVWLKETSQPIIRKGIVNAYQKGAFYCLYNGNTVEKWPIADIFRVVEDYEQND